MRFSEYFKMLKTGNCGTLIDKMTRNFGGTVQVDLADIKYWRELLQITCAVTGERVEDNPEDQAWNAFVF